MTVCLLCMYTVFCTSVCPLGVEHVGVPFLYLRGTHPVNMAVEIKLALVTANASKCPKALHVFFALRNE